MRSRFPKTRLVVLLALVFLGLFAANPLLDPRLPEGHDIRFHLYRLVQLDSLVKQGVLFSRWAPELAYGYGYPIFNYYAPAVYYVAELFHLVGLSFTSAIRATFASALVGMAVAMYAWTRALFNPAAAFIAAAAYVMAPYMMILLVYRGALAELTALSLLPAILWATHRFITRGRSIDGILAAAFYALLILTHNITAMLFTVVLLGYGLSLVSTSGFNSAERVWAKISAGWGRVAFIVGIGLGLSCFFWLPALAERDLVKIHQLYLPTSLHYSNHFTQLNDILGLPRPADSSLVYQPRPMSRLHLAVVLLALAAGVGLWRRRKMYVQKSVTFFFLVGAVLCAVMALSISEVVWERIPLLPFIQFPGRFIGVGSFLLASSAGAAVFLWWDRLAKRTWSWLPLSMLVLILALYVVPWQYMRRHPLMDNLTMLDSVGFERRTGLLGTTTMGEFLPTTVEALPESGSPALSKGGRRIDLESLPPDAEIVRAEYRPQRYEVFLESPDAFTAVFHTFDFAGWRAEIDDELVPITPTDPHGLISIEVPAGRHRLVVEFGTTPVRSWATIVSLLSLLGLLGVVLFRSLPVLNTDQIDEHDPLSIRVALGLLFAVILALVFKLAYVDREGQQTLLRRARFDGQTVVGVDYPLNVNFANQIHLLGMDAPVQIAADEQPEIALYWRIPAPVDREYSVGLMLVDERGIRYAESDHQHPGGIPTRRWQPQEYAQDPYELRILPGTPPGTYTLQATVYPYGQPAQALDILNAQGAPVGRTATLAPLTVTRPQRPPTRKQLAPQSTVNVPVTAGLHFIGYDMPATSQRAGDLLSLILYWEASQALNADLEIKFALRDVNGTLTSLAKVPPVVDYPTSQWVKGDRWRGVHRLLLPPTLDSGTYELVLIGPGSALLVLDTVTVEAPEHILEPPSVSQEQSAEFADLVSLVGYELSPPDSVVVGEALSVDLVWRVHRQTHRSYKTFVHLLDTEGRLVAGSDQVPGSWQRPSTGWIAGEYIVDVHTIAVPSDLLPGTYRLQAGLYDETSSTRLKRANGADTVVLDTPLNVEAP